MTRKRDELIADLEPLALRDGLELVDVELVGSRKAPTVRIYLDSEGGISFDQIMGAHAWIDKYMDEHDPFPGAYTLEVSSPGIDRHLRTVEHFERFAGETAVISTTAKEGRSKWTGELKGVDRDDAANPIVVLDVDGEEVRIPYGQIAKAHVKGRVDFSDGKDK